MSIPQDEEWLQALNALQKLIPGAGDFMPDRIACTAEKCGERVIWRRIPGFGDRDDAEIWRNIKPRALRASGQHVIVIVDACFSRSTGPFTIAYDDLDAWIEAFVDNYSDEVFGGDAVFIFSSGVLLVHHEGLVSEVG
jgi:hypothetical protein